jgi:tetratricopeptide (TPR) repeat protein
MKKTLISDLITNPMLMGENSLLELEKIVDEFPYFHVARIVYTKNLKTENDTRYTNELKKTAIYSTDRYKLHEHFHTENSLFYNEPIDTIPPVPEKQIFEEAEIITNQEQVDKEIPKSIKVDSTPVPKIEHAKDENKNVFDWQSKHSRSTWLKALSESKNPESVTADDKKHENKQTASTVDKILEGIEKLSSREKKKTMVETPVLQSNIAKMSIIDNEDFVTETLAKVYEKQGNYSKAVGIWKKLLLLNPEKSSYFAARISELELIIKNK